MGVTKHPLTLSNTWVDITRYAQRRDSPLSPGNSKS